MFEIKKDPAQREFEIEKMKSLYKEGNSLSEIGETFGLSRARIGQLLRMHGCKIRKRTISGKFKKAMGERRVNLDKKLLANLYTDQKLSMQKIAAQLGTSSDVVYRNLLDYRIPIRTRKTHYKSPLTADLLRRLYLVEKLTVAEIARRLNYTSANIRQRLIKFGFKKPRQAKPSEAHEKTTKPSQTEVIAQRLLTVKEIAEVYGIHPDTVRNFLRQGGFPNAFRKKGGKSNCWIVPFEDLQNFVPRKKGIPRVDQPTLSTIRSRGKYARAKIKRLYGYGKHEITEIINLKRQGGNDEEIAIRYRVDEKYVADILSEAATHQPPPPKKTRKRKELKRLPEKSLIDLYVNGEHSVDYILKVLNTNYTSLYISLRHYGISLRDERLRTAAEENEARLYRLAFEDKLSPPTIAARLQLSEAYVRRKINEIKRRMPL